MERVFFKVNRVSAPAKVTKLRQLIVVDLIA